MSLHFLGIRPTTFQFCIRGDDDDAANGDLGGLVLLACSPYHMLSLCHMAGLMSHVCCRTDVMYINVYGCKEYPNYSTPFHSFICDARNFQSWMPAVAVLYFGSFVTLSGLVVFALFIGAITSSMQVCSIVLSYHWCAGC